jgi:hypothetical protein
MNSALAAIATAVIVLAVFVLGAYGWYYRAGAWTPFTYNAGDTPAWTAASGKSVADLRFKACEFTVTLPNSTPQALDVTAVLNAMATAYKTATTPSGQSPKASLGLTQNLNPFSFVIPGFNDAGTVSSPSAPPWCTAGAVACTSDSGCPYATKGECQSVTTYDANQNATTVAYCSNCNTATQVQLAGFYRTL